MASKSGYKKQDFGFGRNERKFTHERAKENEQAIKTSTIEVPKHKKKVVKSVPKADHKHVYEICLVQRNYPNNSSVLSVEDRCIVCGRTRYSKKAFTMSIEREGAFYRMLTPEELNEKYKNLPRYIKTVQK